MTRQDRAAPDRRGPKTRVRAPYRTPSLEILGSLRAGTRGTGGKGADGALGMTMMSDRRTKREIVAVGRHPLGFNVYRFRYGAPFAAVLGQERRVGVLADEILEHCPAAVVRGADGYLRVDYSRLLA
jgi:hypothetical protein